MAHKKRRRKSHNSNSEAERASNRAGLKKHLKKLNLPSEEAYRRWCANRGLGDGLYKSNRQLEKELKVASQVTGDAALSQKRSHTRNQRNTIIQLYERSIKKGRLGSPALYKIRSQFNQVRDGPPRRALLELFLRAERHSDLLGPDAALTQLEQSPGNSYIEALTSLARWHDEWIRPVGEWLPASHNSQRQFSSLVRHLLAEYDVPIFMNSAWFLGNTSDAIRQQRWFIHVGRGGNIRAVDAPVTLTKMMAHRFLEAPDALLVDHAMRWAQVIGQDGSEALAQAIIHSRLGSSFEHEEFWSTVILFFVRNPMLDPAQIGPLIDFIHNQKYVGREVFGPGGVREVQDPPQPNFSMKSRSVPKLLRNMGEWHRQLAQQIHPDDPPEEEPHSKKRWHRLMQWERCPVGEYICEEVNQSSGRSARWTIRELLSNRELTAEGQAMSHCVTSYGKSCRNGSTSIWSLSAREDDGPRQPVLTIAVDPRARIITQMRGRFNAQPMGKRPRGKGAVDNRYYRLLTGSRKILERWTRQERLTVSC